MHKSIIIEGMNRGGPYAHATIAGGMVYISGQTGYEGRSESDFESQFRKTIENISRIAEDAGTSLRDTVKVNVYLAKKELFDSMNKLFEEYFKSDPPARTTLVTDFVNGKIKVEIDAILSI